MASLLPAHDGLLPYWLLLTAGASIYNTATSYTSQRLAIYQGPTAARQVTPLAARLFGTWTLLSCVVRTYAAYNIDSKDIYAIAFSTYAIALVHLSNEWLVYRTMTMSQGLLPPFAVASITTIWMAVQWGSYTTV